MSIGRYDLWADKNVLFDKSAFVAASSVSQSMLGDMSAEIFVSADKKKLNLADLSADMTNVRGQIRPK